MSVGILLITHKPLGRDLLTIATGIFGACPAPAEVLEVQNDAPCAPLLADAERLAEQLDGGDGVLVLTDIYGSTPANLALDLSERRAGIRVLAGVNLPMLVRTLNYAQLDLEALVEKALTGGRDGVMLCPGRGDRH